MQISVKDVEKQLFREFKAGSVREGIKIGKALNWAMQLWLDQTQKKPKKSILDFKPVSGGKSTERLSEQVDEVLYG